MTLHVGVLGSGLWSRVHLAALEQSPHVARVTLCGRNAEAIAALRGAYGKIAATADEPGRLLDDRSIDVIDIVLPHHLHAPTTLEALAAGKHVICEKPAAVSLAEFDGSTAAAARAGRRFFVVMNQLYNPRMEHLRRQVADGLVGRPFLLVENAYADHSQAYRDPATWRTRTALSGGGVLIDGAYHMVYKQLALLERHGPPRWISAETAQLNLNAAGRTVAEQGEDFVSYTIGYEGPLRVAASHAWTLESTIVRPREGFLAGSEGTLEMPDGVDGPVLLRRHGVPQSVSLPEPLEKPRDDSLRLCLADYLAAIAGQREPALASVLAARQTLQVILAAYESSRCGARIALDA